MENNIIMLEDEHGCMIEFETIDVFELQTKNNIGKTIEVMSK